MLTKKIKYTNFNGVEVEKNFYFNITKAELALRELESDGSWSETLEAIKGSDKGSVVMPEFKKIIKWTYGAKSSDGESFEKSDEIWAKFENSEPWSVLIMELLTDAGYASDFINGVMPADIAAKNREQQAQAGFRPGANTERPTPPVMAQPATEGGPVLPASQPVLKQPVPEEYFAPETVQEQGIQRESRPVQDFGTGQPPQQ